MNNTGLSHPRDGRREKAVAQLLDTGVEAFARYGPEGVTTRRLAKDAGVNSAAISYYFGGKEGYYIAVVKHLVQERAKSVLSLLARVSDELKRSGDPAEVGGKLLRRLLHDLAIAILLKPDGVAIASIISREQLHPTAAFELIYQEAILRMHRTLSELVGHATRTAPDSPDTIVRVHALLGQVLLFRIAGTTICRRLGWDRITEERAEYIAGIVMDMACRAIGLGPPGDGGKSTERGLT